MELQNQTEISVLVPFIPIPEEELTEQQDDVDDAPDDLLVRFVGVVQARLYGRDVAHEQSLFSLFLPVEVLELFHVVRLI